jgi:hypothetical protein
MKTKLIAPLIVLALSACAVPPPASVAEPAVLTPAPAISIVDTLLAYHRSIDAMSQPDLAKELSGLSRAPVSAATEVRKAMVLGIQRQDATARLARAGSVLAGVLLMDDADAVALRPLVEWMMTNNTELRRLALSGERQAQQLKDLQRRFDQLNEKLEAMKRIESSQPASPIEIAPAGQL